MDLRVAQVVVLLAGRLESEICGEVVHDWRARVDIGSACCVQEASGEEDRSKCLKEAVGGL